MPYHAMHVNPHPITDTDHPGSQMPASRASTPIPPLPWKRPLALLLMPVLLAACGLRGAALQDEHVVGSLRLIGEQRIPFKRNVGDTPVGGLSGIDYDPTSNTWVLQSDDRSELAPARFYTARLRYDAEGFTAIDLEQVRFFRQADARTYPGLEQYKTSGGEWPDIESIRIDPVDGHIWYTSEGLRASGRGLDPFVRQASADGRYVGGLPIPELLKVSPGLELGTRNNLGLEGLAFAPDGRSLWVAMEGPIYQDGEPPGIASGSVARLTHLDRQGRQLGQFAYPLDNLPAAPANGKRGDNGVSEILAINAHELLVLERAGIEGADGLYGNHIRLYRVDTTGATDVSAIPSLKNVTVTPLSKRLVLDLGRLGLDRLDNIEGMAWGPRLPNGHPSLVMVSDDNFSERQITQLLAFEVLPR